MKALLENDLYNLYTNENLLMGSIRIKSNFDESEIKTDCKTYKVIRNGWAFTVSEGDTLVCNIKTNSFWGTLTVLELNKRIKGVFSVKWGTQLVDEENNDGDDDVFYLTNGKLYFKENRKKESIQV